MEHHSGGSRAGEEEREVNWIIEGALHIPHMYMYNHMNVHIHTLTLTHIHMNMYSLSLSLSLSLSAKKALK